MRKHLIDVVIESLDRDQRRIVLFSTHILEDVEWLAERVLILLNGEMTADRPVRGLCADGVPLASTLLDLLEAN